LKKVYGLGEHFGRWKRWVGRGSEKGKFDAGHDWPGAEKCKGVLSKENGGSGLAGAGQELLLAM